MHTKYREGFPHCKTYLVCQARRWQVGHLPEQALQQPITPQANVMLLSQHSHTRQPLHHARHLSTQGCATACSYGLCVCLCMYVCVAALPHVPATAPCAPFLSTHCCATVCSHGMCVCLCVFACVPALPQEPVTAPCAPPQHAALCHSLPTWNVCVPVYVVCCSTPTRVRHCAISQHAALYHNLLTCHCVCICVCLCVCTPTHAER